MPESCGHFGDGKSMCVKPEANCGHQQPIGEGIEGAICFRKPPSVEGPRPLPQKCAAVAKK